MIRLDTVLALAAVLVPGSAVRLASGLQRPAADTAARALTSQVERSRVDRAAALATALREGTDVIGGSRGRRDRGLDRFWRDLPSWAHARATGPCRSEPTHTPVRDRSAGARHAT